jgi:hypothetical protein
VSDSSGGTTTASLGGTGTSTLAVTSGAGGTVTSSPGGINCGATCSATFSSSPVTLTATPDATHTFAGWSGACSGRYGCLVTMDSGTKSVTATWAPIVYVDAINGNDSNPGTSAAPYKTITFALHTDAQTVFVKPGTYDVANGESFPFIVNANVRLVGNVASRGLTSPRTRIFGTGSLFSFATTVILTSGASLSGFDIEMQIDGTFAPPGAAVVAAGSYDIVDANTIESPCPFDGILAESTNVAITRNVIYNDDKLETGCEGSNSLHFSNATGVAHGNSVWGGDNNYSVRMTGSMVNLNTVNFGPNKLLGVVSVSVGGATLHAEYNQWAHAPPRQSTTCDPGVDYCSPNDTLDAFGASVITIFP